MTIIIAADDTDAELKEIADRYDRAKNPNERERIAEDAYVLIGDKIKGMVKRVGRGLGADDLEGFAREAVVEALENSGMTKIKKADTTWENLIQRHKDGNAVAKRIFGLMTPDLRKALEAPYLKASTADQLLREINNGMLRRPDFFDPATWVGVSLPGEARVLLEKGLPNLSRTELSRFNALALAAACPEITVPSQPPTRSIWGYLSKFWLPSNRSRIAELGGAPPASEYLLEAKNALKPVVEQLRQMEASGTMPPELARQGQAQRIYTLYRQLQQQRYGVTIKWWNERVAELQPNHPFKVDSPAALKDAKALLGQHPDKVDVRLWREKSSPHFLPSSAIEGFGIQIIQRVLDLGGCGSKPVQLNVPRNAPAAPSTRDMEAANLLRGGHQSPAFRYLVDRLFEQGQTEHLIGMFLANNPSPSKAQVEQFQSSLPDEVLEDIESEGGWNKLVYYHIDSVILEAVKNPKFRAEIERALEMQPNEVTAAADFIRLAIFCRTGKFIASRRLYA